MPDDERRARIAVRHALAPAWRQATPEAAVRAMTVLHATEPATVYLSGWARVAGFTPADLDRALYADRTLVKQLAMRRTLFVFPAALLGAAWPSASARVAASERARIAKLIVRTGLSGDGHDWLDRARAEVLAVLAGAPDGRVAAEIRAAVPMLDTDAGRGITPQVLLHLGLTGDIVRGTNAGRWHTSRPRWTLTRNWLPAVPPVLDAAAGYRELVRHWLHTFGPGTEDDLVWWLGSTRAVVRTALAELDARPVSLDGGGAGWLLPDDTAATADPGPWVALLPVLDPTVMGWKDRGFYLGPHREQLFDRNGNAGATAWVDGRIVGTWVQDAAGVVTVRLLENVPARSRTALDAEAARLTAWLGGFRVPSVYRSPAMTASVR